MVPICVTKQTLWFGGKENIELPALVKWWAYVCVIYLETAWRFFLLITKPLALIASNPRLKGGDVGVANLTQKP